MSLSIEERTALCAEGCENYLYHECSSPSEQDNDLAEYDDNAVVGSPKSTLLDWSVSLKKEVIRADCTDACNRMTSQLTQMGEKDPQKNNPFFINKRKELSPVDWNMLEQQRIAGTFRQTGQEAAEKLVTPGLGPTTSGCKKYRHSAEEVAKATAEHKFQYERRKLSDPLNIDRKNFDELESQIAKNRQGFLPLPGIDPTEEAALRSLLKAGRRQFDHGHMASAQTYADQIKADIQRYSSELSEQDMNGNKAAFLGAVGVGVIGGLVVYIFRGAAPRMAEKGAEGAAKSAVTAVADTGMKKAASILLTMAAGASQKQQEEPVASPSHKK